eukprot:TRINITY_DN19372_c0_g1_i1.p1 TRINITY_DN19372_c0_g1~~TRINITY_DN19372_c0_g1_i1.p1  ORF type:complete len:302 (+),score=51.29 TRINITY_DN19372_c0_g1_i1:21-926(+)
MRAFSRDSLRLAVSGCCVRRFAESSSIGAGSVVPKRRQRVCLVQGASRGLGLELVRQLARRGDTVFATCRDPAAAAALADVQATFPNTVALLPLDVCDESSIADAAGEVAKRAPGVDLLLNTAGVLQDTSSGIIPERTVTKVNASAAAESFAVNALGPLLMMKHFTPLLRSAAASSKADAASSDASTVGGVYARAVFYSARVGSIGDNGTGGWYSYRGSKAALNQFVRCFALELKAHGICCLALHPGTVDTDLTRAFARARAKYEVQTVEVAVENHLRIIDSLDMMDSGKFFDWRRKEVAW